MDNAQGVPPQPLAGDEREELVVRRIEDSVVKKIHSQFAIFGTVLAILAAAGLFAFGKYIELTLSDSISRSVNAAASKEITQISAAVSRQVEAELRKLDQRLTTIESGVEEARKKADRTLLETEVSLRGTVERVDHMGRLLVEDVEKRRREILAELLRESQRFADARTEAEKRAAQILNRISAELSNLEKLTTVVRAPLRQKIGTLKALKLEKTAPDADIQRYLAILVLKELEDGELVSRERAAEDAREVLAGILANEHLRDDYFAEVRLRAIRAVGELGLVDIAVERALRADSWERRNLILLLGALKDAKALSPLVRVVRDRREPVEIRDAGVRSIAAIIGRFRREWRVEFVELFAKRPFFSVEQAEDPEIEALTPRRRGLVLGTKIPEEPARAAADQVGAILSDRRETESLRRTALRALSRIGDLQAAERVKGVLLDEWRDYGEDAIDFFAGIRAEASIAPLQEFVLRSGADKSLRRRAVSVLIALEMRGAIPALREIAEKDPDAELRTMAAEGVKRLSERLR